MTGVRAVELVVARIAGYADSGDTRNGEGESNEAATAARAVESARAALGAAEFERPYGAPDEAVGQFNARRSRSRSAGACSDCEFFDGASAAA